MAGAFARPARATLTAFGTVLGVAALVSTLGIARTAGGQLLARFDELAATTVIVSRSDDSAEANATDPSTVLPFTPERRLRLRGVVAAGSYAKVDVGSATVRAVPVADPRGTGQLHLTIIAASPGLRQAVQGTMSTGQWFDRIHDDRQERVAVLGRGAAAKLRIDRVDQSPALFIGEEAFVVVGILDEVERKPDLLNAVIIPERTAANRFGLTSPELVVIDTAIGAAQLIGRQAPAALAPHAVEHLRVRIPPDLASLQRGAAADVNALFLLLGAISLIIGALGIANVTLVSVFERTGEIGVRRALGATRRSIVLQFLLESALLGTIGGLLGASAGIVVVVGTAAVRQWTPILDLRIAVAAPLVGAAIGLLSGAYPAWRAGAVEPADAVRGGVA